MREVFSQLPQEILKLRMTCPQCAAVIVQSGIARIVFTPSENEHWGRPPLSEEMFCEAGIELKALSW